LGSVRYVTDANGKLIGTQGYSAYGAIVSRSGVTGQLGYAGMWQHETSGLNLTRYRPYNPRVGRWLSRDPIGEEGD
jgi:RHS repeat-associated protein